jgi:hypothetical protein
LATGARWWRSIAKDDPCSAPRRRRNLRGRIGRPIGLLDLEPHTQRARGDRWVRPRRTGSSAGGREAWAGAGWGRRRPTQDQVTSEQAPRTTSRAVRRVAHHDERRPAARDRTLQRAPIRCPAGGGAQAGGGAFTVRSPSRRVE